MSETRRADLHVHTCHSKVCGTLPFLGSRDCYSSPHDVYRVAKARGMDFVAFTDHDSIDGALDLLSAHPELDDVIVGEEVSCWLPDTGIQVHFGAYGMSERLHRELQPLRRNAFDVAAFLREADIFFALNHLLHFYRGQIPFESYLRLLDAAPAVEARNGTMLPAHNLLIERLVGQSSAPHRLTMVGGSDAHTLRRVGRTWTSAPGETRDQFLSSLKKGLGRPGGDHGSAGAVAGDAYGVVASYVAALAGFGPRDIRGWRRAGCLAFATVSLPGQFVVPLAVALSGKWRERRKVQRALADVDRSVSSTPPASLQKESEA